MSLFYFISKLDLPEEKKNKMISKINLRDPRELKYVLEQNALARAREYVVVDDSGKSRVVEVHLPSAEVSPLRDDVEDEVSEFEII